MASRSMYSFQRKGYTDVTTTGEGALLAAWFNSFPNHQDVQQWWSCVGWWCGYFDWRCFLQCWYSERFNMDYCNTISQLNALFCRRTIGCGFGFVKRDKKPGRRTQTVLFHKSSASAGMDDRGVPRTEIFLIKHPTSGGRSFPWMDMDPHLIQGCCPLW